MENKTFNKDKITKQLEKAREEFNIKEINNYKNMNKKELVITAKYLQTFNFIEHKIKIIFSHFKKTGAIIEQDKKHSTSYMIMKISEYLSKSNITKSEASSYIYALSTIEACIEYRNIFAHWVGRKMSIENVIVFITSDPKDFKKMFNCKPGLGHILPAFMNLEIIQYHLNILHDCDAWLYKIISKYSLIK